MEKIVLRTKKQEEMVDITDLVKKVVVNSKVNFGICIVYVPHTTAAITINESWDPSVKEDIINSLSNLIPEHGRYLHVEGNSHAHIKASIIGSSRTVIIQNGTLALGTYQGIFFMEFDGPRTREVYVEIIPKSLQNP